MASANTIKNLSFLALVQGLNAHIKDSYKAKHIKKTCDKITEKFNETLSLWDDSLDGPEVYRVEQNILIIGGFLHGQHVSAYVSLMLATIDDMRKILKDQKKPDWKKINKLGELEDEIVVLNNKIDLNLQKNNLYELADRCLKRFSGMSFTPNSQDKYAFNRKGLQSI